MTPETEDPAERLLLRYLGRPNMRAYRDALARDLTRELGWRDVTVLSVDPPGSLRIHATLPDGTPRAMQVWAEPSAD